MENLLKLTLTNPVNFDFGRLLGALALTGEKFELEKSAGKTTVLCNDKMQMLKQKPILSQIPYNYVPMVTFEMTEEAKIKSIELGSHMRFKFLSAFTKHKDIPEFHILQKYTEKSVERLHKGIDLIAENQKIQYATPQNNSKLIASVYQAHYAFANGPKGKIDHLGTRGIATCTGLAMVAKQDQNARVVVMHLDARNDIAGSIDDAITTLKANTQEISAYVVADKKGRIDETVLCTLNSLQERGIRTQLDLSDDRLVIDLRSGLPIKSTRTKQEEWLEPNPHLENIMEQSLLTFNFSQTKGLVQNARKEYDLMTGPVGYIKMHMPN